MGLRLTIGRDPLELVELAFAGAMAQQNRGLVLLDVPVRREAGRCRARRRERPARRRQRADHAPQPLRPRRLVDRIRPRRRFSARACPRHPKVRRGNFADLTTHPPDKLDQRSLQVEELVDDVTQFGMLALGIPWAAQPPNSTASTASEMYTRSDPANPVATNRTRRSRVTGQGRRRWSVSDTVRPDASSACARGPTRRGNGLDSHRWALSTEPSVTDPLVRSNASGRACTCRSPCRERHAQLPVV